MLRFGEQCAALRNHAEPMADWVLLLPPIQTSEVSSQPRGGAWHPTSTARLLGAAPICGLVLFPDWIAVHPTDPSLYVPLGHWLFWSAATAPTVAELGEMLPRHPE